MDSLAARNAVLLLILGLLWHVIGGVYRQSQEMNLLETPPFNVTAKESTKVQGLTEAEVQAIMTTKKLPDWAKGPHHRRLTLEEIEEIVSRNALFVK